VPPGIVLPVEFFASWFVKLKCLPEWEAFLAAASPDETRKACDCLKTKAAKLSFSDEQRIAVMTALQEFGVDCLYAVRSSSPEEDLAGTSFAGIYETILGATLATIEEAVKKAFASCLDYRIVTYKCEHGFDTTNPKIAVVIQKQIASEIAGVGFSLNPVTNNYDEAVFNSNWGLGESVVSGIATPDTFTVDKVSRLLTHKQLGKKELSIWLTASGGTEDKVHYRSVEFTLSESEIRALTDLIIRVEQLYGMPIDIEWAFSNGNLYLLQAGPITAYVPLSPEMVTSPGERKRLYLDVTISVQGIYKPLSAMGTSILKRFVSRGVKQIFGVRPFVNINTSIPWVAWGRLYLVLSNVIAIFGKDRVARFMVNMDPLAAKTVEELDQQDYVDRRHNVHPPLYFILRLPVYLFRILRAFLCPRWAQRRIETVVKEFMHDTRELSRQNISPWDLADKLLTRTFCLVLTTSMPPFIASRIAFEQIKRLVGKEEAQLTKLERALPNNVTTEMGMALFRLSQLPPASAQFENAWQDFVDLYGCRGPGELDIASPRYRDQPQLLLDQVEILRSSTTEKDNPLCRYEIAQQERKEAFERLCQTAKHGWLSSMWFRFCYRTFEPLAGYRELHKYCLIFALDLLRERLLLEAKSLRAAGRLDMESQIFDLTIDDLQAAASNAQLDLRKVARKNREPLDRLEQVPRLPALIDSRGLIPRPAAGSPGEGEVVGTAISPGVARGRIKVLHTADEKPLLRGEILVASATDPGWTPLFVNAAAVILEVGGMLQHGALVAREYGLPCVSGIDRATELWQDGTLVEVDGSRGTIRILSEPTN